MKFVCDRCQTRYTIADEKVRQRILRIRCKTCGNVITVQSGEVPPGPQDASRRPEPGAWASSALPSRPSSWLSRIPPDSQEWFVAVDGAEQGPLSCTDAARIIVSLKPEQLVHVWKEGMDGWKRPKDVAIIAQEISVLRLAPADVSLHAPAAPMGADRSSVPRLAPSSADSADGDRASASRPKPLPAEAFGSGPRLPQPGSRPKLAPSVPGSGPKLAPPPIPGSGLKMAPRPSAGSGPKLAPPPIPGSGPKMAPRPSTGSGPKLVPPPIPGSERKRAPVGGSLPAGASLKRGPALPGLTPAGPAPLSPSAGPTLQTEFDRAPATKPEKRPSRAQTVEAPGTPLPDITPPILPLTEDELAQGQRTPLPSESLPPIAGPPGDGHGGQDWPSSPRAFPYPALPSAGSLFGHVAGLPAAPLPWAPAEVGPSRSSDLAILAHRHRHLKYVVAASVVVVLVILVILLSWRAESGKTSASAQQPAGPVPEAPSPGEAEPPPHDENTGGPAGRPKERAAARVAPKRSRSAGIRGRRAAVGEDPFEGPPSSSGVAERPAPVERPGQPRRSRSGPSGEEDRGVSQAQISEVVRNKENQAGLKTCYERALKRDGRLRTGRLDVTVSVGQNGGVQRVQVHGPSDFMIIDDCIKNAIRHWRFPASAEEYATSFPLILQGG